jgi:hypothetical protein
MDYADLYRLEYHAHHLTKVRLADAENRAAAERRADPVRVAAIRWIRAEQALAEGEERLASLRMAGAACQNAGPGVADNEAMAALHAEYAVAAHELRAAAAAAAKADR